ncbi:MAG: LON peptidase substrate-binding domain-containing protein [Sinobacteraceae bacterium]|nr:LON peptidase substrate-binding domain-containing protein [Nevskiaceae bacterium]MBV8851820.1 LON peptidase substrate-binding domain-containing protein [Nevskiaceae bacterium]
MSVTAQPAAAPGASCTVPLFPLSTVLFPGGPLRLRIFEPRYIDMIGACMRTQQPFGVVLIGAGSEVGAGAAQTLCGVGTTARVIDFNALPDGLLGISCTGERKFALQRHWQQEDGLNIGEVEYAAAEQPAPLPPQCAHLALLLRKLLPELGELYASIPERFEDASWVGLRLAEILPISLTQKQACLEVHDAIERIERLNQLIRRVDE